ncbi:hypothetical protein QYF36_000119 [Acer negundo]|nr:hypothetical protein QYF36_000119 [Acer negundo]
MKSQEGNLHRKIMIEEDQVLIKCKKILICGVVDKEEEGINKVMKNQTCNAMSARSLVMEEVKSLIFLGDTDMPSKIAEPVSSMSTPSTGQSPHSSPSCQNSPPSSPESTPKKMRSLTDIYDACDYEFALIALEPQKFEEAVEEEK